MRYALITVFSVLIAWTAASSASANPCAPPLGSSLSAAERTRMDATERLRRASENLAKGNLRRGTAPAQTGTMTGTGTVHGLTVGIRNPRGGGTGTIVIQPGYALDSNGNLIRLCAGTGPCP